jgi:hypothetical protein
MNKGTDTTDIFFSHKEPILISRRYQLHPASATTHDPSGLIDAHNPKKKRNYKKE